MLSYVPTVVTTRSPHTRIAAPRQPTQRSAARAPDDSLTFYGQRQRTPACSTPSRSSSDDASSGCSSHTHSSDSVSSGSASSHDSAARPAARRSTTRRRQERDDGEEDDGHVGGGLRRRHLADRRDREPRRPDHDPARHGERPPQVLHAVHRLLHRLRRRRLDRHQRVRRELREDDRAHRRPREGRAERGGRAEEQQEADGRRDGRHLRHQTLRAAQRKRDRSPPSMSILLVALALPGVALPTAVGNSSCHCSTGPNSRRPGALR